MNTIFRSSLKVFSPKKETTKKKRPPYFVYKPRFGFGLYLGYPPVRQAHRRQKTTLSTEV